MHYRPTGLNLLNVLLRQKQYFQTQKVLKKQVNQQRHRLYYITLETNVKDDLDADSLDLFQIINDIEDEFDVSVEDPEAIVTVKDAVDFVESHKN